MIKVMNQSELVRTKNQNELKNKEPSIERDNRDQGHEPVKTNDQNHDKWRIGSFKGG
jgi:hypothetical protein